MGFVFGLGEMLGGMIILRSRSGRLGSEDRR